MNSGFYLYYDMYFNLILQIVFMPCCLISLDLSLLDLFLVPALAKSALVLVSLDLTVILPLNVHLVLSVCHAVTMSHSMVLAACAAMGSSLY